MPVTPTLEAEKTIKKQLRDRLTQTEYAVAATASMDLINGPDPGSVELYLPELRKAGVLTNTAELDFNKAVDFLKNVEIPEVYYLHWVPEYVIEPEETDEERELVPEKRVKELMFGKPLAEYL